MPRGSQDVLDIYELTDRVVQQLDPFCERIKNVTLRNEVEATLQVVFWFPIADGTSTPILGFSARTVKFVAETGASIDLDSYRDEGVDAAVCLPDSTHPPVRLRLANA